MTALHLHAQLQSLINSTPVGVCEVYTLESLIESQWPSTADRGMIFFSFFVVVLVVLFYCLLSSLLFFVCITCKCHVACGVLIICSALTAIHN